MAGLSCYPLQPGAHRRIGAEIEAAITTAIRRVIIGGMPKESATPRLTSEIIATATSWAIYGAVKQWFYTPGHAPAEEIVPAILQLIVPMLITAGPIDSHQIENLVHPVEV